MPWMQTFVQSLNARFNSANIGDVDANLVGPGSSLVQAARNSSKGQNPLRASQEVQDYLNQHVAAADLEALREVLHWAVTQEPRVPVQFLWVPGGGSQLTLQYWNVAGAQGSSPGVSVLLTGPIPPDTQTQQYPSKEPAS